jgi:hypothetical protein
MPVWWLLGAGEVMMGGGGEWAVSTTFTEIGASPTCSSIPCLDWAFATPLAPRRSLTVFPHHMYCSVQVPQAGGRPGLSAAAPGCQGVRGYSGRPRNACVRRDADAHSCVTFCKASRTAHGRAGLRI